MGESGAPESPEEAADQFEKVLVRQFVKVMTEDMFSGSHAGEGGGKWMESQRDRQRDLMTDMITDRITEANTLEVSKTLERKWGIEDDSEAGAATPAALEARPRASSESENASPARPLIDTPPTHSEESHIDHAV